MIANSSKERLVEIANRNLGVDLPDTLNDLLDNSLLRNLISGVTAMLEETKGLKPYVENASSNSPVLLASALRLIGKRAIGILEGLERKRGGKRELATAYQMMLNDVQAVIASIGTLDFHDDAEAQVVAEAEPEVEEEAPVALNQTAARIEVETAAKPTKTLKSLSDLRKEDVKTVDPKVKLKASKPAPKPAKPEPKVEEPIELPPVIMPGKAAQVGPGGRDDLTTKNFRSLQNIEQMLHRYEHERGAIPRAIGKNDPGFVIFKASVMITTETPLNSTRAHNAGIPLEFISGSPEPGKVSHQSHFIYVVKDQFVLGLPATDDASLRAEKMRAALSGLRQTTKKNYTSVMAESPRPFFRSPGNQLVFALLLDSHALMAMGNPNPLEIGFPLAKDPLHKLTIPEHHVVHEEQEDWKESPGDTRRKIKPPEVRVPTPRDAVEKEIEQRKSSQPSSTSLSLSDIRNEVEKTYNERFATEIKRLDLLRDNLKKIEVAIDTADPGRITYRLIRAGHTGHAFQIQLDNVRAIRDPYKRDQALAKLLKSSVDVAKRFLEQTSHMDSYSRPKLEKKIGDLITKGKQNRQAIIDLEGKLKTEHEKLLAEARARVRKARK